MKKQLIIALTNIILLFLIFGLQAQSPNESMKTDADGIYRQYELDQAVGFPGGVKQIMNYFSEHVSYNLTT